MFFITNQLRTWVFTQYRRGLRCPTGVLIRSSSAHFIHDAPSSRATGLVHGGCRNQFENYRRGTRTLRGRFGGKINVWFYHGTCIIPYGLKIKIKLNILLTEFDLVSSFVFLFLFVRLFKFENFIFDLLFYVRNIHHKHRSLHAWHFGFRRFEHSMELSSVNCSPRDQIVPDSCNGNNWANEQLDFNWQMQVKVTILDIVRYYNAKYACDSVRCKWIILVHNVIISPVWVYIDNFKQFIFQVLYYLLSTLIITKLHHVGS